MDKFFRDNHHKWRLVDLTPQNRSVFPPVAMTKSLDGITTIAETRMNESLLWESRSKTKTYLITADVTKIYDITKAIPVKYYE